MSCSIHLCSIVALLHRVFEATCFCTEFLVAGSFQWYFASRVFVSGRYTDSQTEKQWFKSRTSNADAEYSVDFCYTTVSIVSSFRMLMWSTALVVQQLLHDAVHLVRYWSAILGQVILVVGYITQCMLSAGSHLPCGCPCDHWARQWITPIRSFM